MRKNNNIKPIFIAFITDISALFLLVFTIIKWETLYYRWLFLVISFVLITICSSILNRYSSNTISSAIKHVAELFFKAIISSINKIRNAFGITSYKRKGTEIIKDYKDEITTVSHGIKKDKKKYNFKSWNNMTENEKVRYLYAKRMLKRINEGCEYRLYLTPQENTEMLIIRGNETTEIKELLEYYNMARYSNKNSISRNATEKLKKKYIR